MRRSLLCSAVSLAVAAAAFAVAPAPDATRRPDLILIVTDDLDARTARQMPRAQALFAQQGTSYERAYVTNPICAPSRASILTGEYTHNHHVLTNTGATGGFAKFLPLEAQALPTWLRAAGYHTVLLGKYLNGYPARDQTHVPPGWNEWFGLFGGFHFYKYFMNQNGDVLRFGRTAADYETDVLRSRVVDIIARAGDAPLFLYVAPSAPHHPAKAARRDEQALPDARAPRPPSFAEADVSDKPAWIRGEPIGAAGATSVDEIERHRRQALLAVDELLDALIAALQKAGRLQNAYLIFTSDNGFHLGEHRQVGKGTPYEEAIRVPLYVRGPGVPAGRNRDELALNIDLAPTLAELAGARAPDAIDGRSLVPLLKAGPAGAWRRDFLVEHWGEGPRDIPNFTELRQDAITYVEYATGERELYDLTKDPFQLQNHIGAVPATELKALSDRLARLRSCKSASCRD